MIRWDSGSKTFKYRDLTLVKLEDDLVLAVACDSSGAIGTKELDVVKVPGYIVGRFAARVAVMELLSIGVTPTVVVNNVCIEPEGAYDIVKGILDELKEADLDHSPALTGSTEKNIPTRQTGLGVTAIGTCRINDIKAGLTLPGDIVYCVGIPKVGDEVNIHDPEIVTLKTVRTLRYMDEVHEIVPVGSQGILKEAELLVRLASVTLELEELDPNGEGRDLDLSKTAGPATCVVLSAEPDKNFLARLRSLIPQPVSAIGVCRG